MTRILTLRVVAEALGYSPRYVQQIATDQGKPPAERQYPEATHRRFPQFEKNGNRCSYVVPEARFVAFMRKLGKQWGEQ